MYIWTNCPRSVKELSQPDNGISLSEKRIISQRALPAEKRSSIKVTLRSIYCGLLLFGQVCLNSVKKVIPFISAINVISTGNASLE